MQIAGILLNRSISFSLENSRFSGNFELLLLSKKEGPSDEHMVF